MESELARLLRGLASDHIVRYREQGLKVHREIVQPLDATAHPDHSS